MIKFQYQSSIYTIFAQICVVICHSTKQLKHKFYFMLVVTSNPLLIKMNSFLKLGNDS